MKGRGQLWWHALAQWVALIDALSVYPESSLYRLEAHGISYDASVPVLRVVTHNYWTERGNPYGSLRCPQVLSPRALMEEAAKVQLVLQLSSEVEGRLLLGASLITDIWALMKVESPPVVTKYTKMAAIYAAALQGGSR